MIDNNKIIHLYLLSRCTHECKLCCNKQYDVDKIPVVTVDELKYADTILLTGGEPFLLGKRLIELAENIKFQFGNIKNIYVYTCGDSLVNYLVQGGRLHSIDGVNISPKNRHDVDCVEYIRIFYPDVMKRLRSNRIYMFPQFRENLMSICNNSEAFRDNTELIDREWQEEFNAASGIFRRLPILMWV